MFVIDIFIPLCAGDLRISSKVLNLMSRNFQLRETSVRYYFKEGKEITEYVVGKRTGQESAFKRESNSIII